MFTIVKDRQFAHEVTVNQPVDGGFEKSTFTARYRALTATETESFDLTDANGVVGFLTAAVVSATDLQDEDKKPLEWNDALRDALLADYWIRQALLDTYTTALLKARLGN